MSFFACFTIDQAMIFSLLHICVVHFIFQSALNFSAIELLAKFSAFCIISSVFLPTISFFSAKSVRSSHTAFLTASLCVVVIFILLFNSLFATTFHAHFRYGFAALAAAHTPGTAAPSIHAVPTHSSAFLHAETLYAAHCVTHSNAQAPIFHNVLAHLASQPIGAVNAALPAIRPISLPTFARPLSAISHNIFPINSLFVWVFTFDGSPQNVFTIPFVTFSTHLPTVFCHTSDTHTASHTAGAANSWKLSFI